MIKMKEHASMPSNPRKSPSVRLLHGKADFIRQCRLQRKLITPKESPSSFPLVNESVRSYHEIIPGLYLSVRP